MGTHDQHLSTSIEDIPAELLTNIFQFVHHQSLAEFRESANDDPYDKKWFLRPNFILPRFPDALAQVSPRWQAIMTSIPEFWTVLVVDSSKPIPNNDIQTRIDRSSDMPLDILVTRRPGCPILTSEEEKALLSPLIANLAPYLHRCNSFSFYAIHSSALPYLGRDISGALPNLTKLRLECEIDDGGASPAFEWTSISCPNLHTLALDGHNFTNLANMDGLWPLQLPQLKSLSLVRLVPLSDEERMAGRERLSLYDFLDLFADQSLNLQYLRLYDFELTNVISEDFVAAFNLSKALVVEDLSQTFTHEFFYATLLHSPELHISRCSLNAMTLPHTPALRLEEVSEFDHLTNHLRNWHGTTLTLVRCGGLDDDFLDMLGAVNMFSGAPNLAKFTILDCTGFTVKGMMRMLESRNKKVEEGAEWPGLPAIEGLIVGGRGPTLDTADRDWLSGRLKHLAWDTVVAGGGSD